MPPTELYNGRTKERIQELGFRSQLAARGPRWEETRASITE